MKVKYIKLHNGIEPKTVKEETEERGRYLINVGVAIEVKESKKASTRKTKELKTEKNTK